MNEQSLDALIDLLDQEHAIYTELGSLLQRERELLLAMKAPELGELVARKETLALRVKALDESRKTLARRLAIAYGLSGDEVTVSRLVEVAPPAHGKRLRAAADRLRDTLTHCRALNDHNTIAARKGLELVQGAIQHVVDSADPGGRVYEGRRRGAVGAYGAAPAAVKMKRAHMAPGLISRRA